MKTLLASALLAIAAIIGAALLFVAQEEAPETMIQAELAGSKFRYARAYARDEATGVGGLLEKLSFLVAFPTFAPVKLRGRRSDTIAVTLTSKDDGLDPKGRPAKLYARFLTPETFEGPGGLVLRHFEQNSPYDLEELFIAPPDGKDFFARCPKADTGALTEACISIFRAGDFDVELRYAPTILKHWEALYEGAQAMLAQMTSAQTRKKKR
jgi:hypothetical protein